MRVALGYGEVEREDIFLGVLRCDVGGGVSKDGEYLFGTTISKDFECFERFVPPRRLT